MEPEPWNKVVVPFPSAASLSAIAFTESSAAVVTSVVRSCEDVLTLLSSEVLQTEIRVLYEILHVFHHSMRQHKPFRVLKQVEQCINRVKEMKLRWAVEELKDLCPNAPQQEAGLACGRCDVPSQASLEWICLKLLGGARLLLRLLQLCVRAFSLSRQHMLLREFIVLNLVITALLSRLWVFFGGVLRALVPLYSGAVELCQTVTRSRPSAFLTHFTLPVRLRDFLQTCCETPTLSVLDRWLGGDSHKDAGPEETPMTSSPADVPLDLGTAVQQERTEIWSSGLDMKTVLQTSHSSRLSAGEDGQKRSFLRRLEKVSSFRDMSVRLQELITCCRRRRTPLAFLLLTCRAMERLEARGIRVTKRLKKFKLKMKRSLQLQKSSATSSRSFSSVWRTRWLLRHRRWREHHRRVRPTRSRRGPVKEVDQTVISTPPQVSPHQSTSTQAACALIQKPNDRPMDEIDDIFASLGF